MVYFFVSLEGNEMKMDSAEMKISADLCASALSGSDWLYFSSRKRTTPSGGAHWQRG